MRRRRRVPREVAAAVPGRVLAAAPAGDGWLVGTRRELLVLDGDAEVALRLPWEQVQSAEWDADRDELEVIEVGEFGRPRGVHTFSPREPSRLLELVRERVTASVVLQRRVVVGEGRGFTVLARRNPAGGDLRWMCEYDEGVDPADAEVAALAEEALAGARAEVGDTGSGILEE